MAKFDAQTLGELRDVQEVAIRTGKHPESAVVIWVVVADDEVFVRSWRGAKGRWYRDLAASGPATLEFARPPVGGACAPSDRSRCGRPGQPRVPPEVSAEYPCAGDGALRILTDHAAARTALISMACHGPPDRRGFGSVPGAGAVPHLLEGARIADHGGSSASPHDRGGAEATCADRGGDPTM